MQKPMSLRSARKDGGDDTPGVAWMVGDFWGAGIFCTPTMQMPNSSLVDRQQGKSNGYIGFQHRFQLV